MGGGISGPWLVDPDHRLLWPGLLPVRALISGMYHVCRPCSRGQPDRAWEKAFFESARLQGPCSILQSQTRVDCRNSRHDFFPFRTLASTWQKFHHRTLAVLALLALGCCKRSNLLGESRQKILPLRANGESELWTYVSLRPATRGPFLPFSCCWEPSSRLATLNRMRSHLDEGGGPCPLQPDSGTIDCRQHGVCTGVLQIFNETLVGAPQPPFNANGGEKSNLSIPAESNIRTRLVEGNGNNQINARTVAGRVKQVVVASITIYNRARKWN